MSLSRNGQCIVIAGSLFISACDGSSDSASITGNDIQLQDSTTTLVVGNPGSSVDCKNTVPCRWVSIDSQFTLTISNADNTATRSRLAIDYTIATVHDSTLLVSHADEIVPADGASLRATDVLWQAVQSSAAQTVLSGTSVEGALHFDNGFGGDSIQSWSLAVLDGGLLRTPSFNNLPVGPLRTSAADCQIALPCQWSSPENDVTITLQALGETTKDGTLGLDFIIQARADMTVVLDAGASAVGTGNVQLAGRVHALGARTDHAKLTAQTIAEIPINGSIEFYRVVSLPRQLQELSLVIYQDKPVPRWNPQFINVPVQL